MNTAGAILAMGGLIVGYEALRFLSVKEMSFSLASLDADQQGLTTNVQLGVRVDNPTAWSNTIDGLDGDVFANGRYLGHATVLGPIPIPSYMTSIIPLSLSLSDVSLAAVVLAIFAGTSLQAIMNFKGKVKADGLPFAVPLDLTYQIV
jgi:hypothetical protein